MGEQTNRETSDKMREQGRFDRSSVGEFANSVTPVSGEIQF